MTRSLAIEDLPALGLVGRDCSALESGVQFRGFVSAVTVTDDFLTVDLEQVERREAGQPWREAEAFSYCGRRDIVSARLRNNGAVAVAIQYIGSLEIAPSGRSLWESESSDKANL